MYIIVGSRALEHFGLHRKEPRDLDLWVEQGTTELESKNDLYVISGEILQGVPVVFANGKRYATPNAIYTIKCSHFAWDIKWEKTKADILWLESHGCTLLPDLYKDLKAHWEDEYGDKSFLSLNKTKEYFFNDNVVYKHDHDYLHELVAHPDQPMYRSCLKDGQAVLIDRAKFDLLPFESRVRMFREEITVIAFERWMVHSDTISWCEAYQMSLKKTITNLTKNWACDFIIFNLKHFVKFEYYLFDNVLKTLKREEYDMSVDLTIFIEIAEKLQQPVSRLIYEMCEACIGDDNGLDIHWKESGAAVDKIMEEYEYEFLDSEGGGEGGSEYCYGVFKLGG